MKKFTLSLFLLISGTFAASANASDMMIAAAMQRCTSNEECALVTNSCSDNCGFVPVNKSNMSTIESEYQGRCGKPMNANPTCNMNPPIAAACVNSRCTIDYAYVHNAGAADYQSGAYPVSEPAAPSQVHGDYSHVDDRHGFTAYNLPSNEIRQSTLGVTNTTVYVPPSAPVNGGSYVPVTQAGTTAPAAMPAPMAPASVPMVPATAAAVPPPAQAPMPAAAMAPAAGTPATAMPMPQQAPVAPAPVSAPMAAGSTYVPPQPQINANRPVPAVGAPGVPVAPPGAVPIPPSDLQPQPTFVPPTGTAVPVGPDDPGAVPPGAALTAPLPTPTADATPGTGQRSFSGLSARTSTYTGTNN